MLSRVYGLEAGRGHLAKGEGSLWPRASESPMRKKPDGQSSRSRRRARRKSQRGLCGAASSLVSEQCLSSAPARNLPRTFLIIVLCAIHSRADGVFLHQSCVEWLKTISDQRCVCHPRI